jgi:peptidoglycan/LPS O-acetylase OafA/YrhL
VFFILNPAWWSAPLQMPAEVLRLRTSLADGQVAYYGGFANTTDRVTALFTEIWQPAQYYEDIHGWPDWIAGQIKDYEASGLGGVGWSSSALLVLVIGSLLVWLLPAVKRPAGPAVLLVGATLIFSVAAVFFLTPLAWQRYYLPLAALWAVYYGAALVAGGRWLWARVRRSESIYAR